MPEFRIESSGKRIAVDARHVAAVLETEEICSIVLSNGIEYRLTTSYDITIKKLKDQF
jgi:hypothetical protein